MRAFFVPVVKSAELRGNVELFTGGLAICNPERIAREKTMSYVTDFYRISLWHNYCL